MLGFAEIAFLDGGLSLFRKKKPYFHKQTSVALYPGPTRNLITLESVLILFKEF